MRSAVIFALALCGCSRSPETPQTGQVSARTAIDGAEIRGCEPVDCGPVVQTRSYAVKDLPLWTKRSQFDPSVFAAIVRHCLSEEPGLVVEVTRPGRLVVSTSPKNHERLPELLARLRRRSLAARNPTQQERLRAEQLKDGLPDERGSNGRLLQTRSYTVEDLPLWTKQGQFDGSVLVAFIQLHDATRLAGTTDARLAGDTGTLIAFLPSGGQLIVKESRSNHRKIEAVLRKLRHAYIAARNLSAERRQDAERLKGRSSDLRRGMSVHEARRVLGIHKSDCFGGGTPDCYSFGVGTLQLNFVTTGRSRLNRVLRLVGVRVDEVDVQLTERVTPADVVEPIE